MCPLPFESKLKLTSTLEQIPCQHICHATGVKEACSEFLEKQLDPANCLGIRLFAENHGCETLRAASSLYTHKHFEEVVQHEEFRTLAALDVQKLISSDEIQVCVCGRRSQSR